MKKSSNLTVIFIILIVTAFLSCNQKNVYVKEAIDGDTIKLSSGESVRYIGIDTPEMRSKDSGWAYDPKHYAEEAKDFNRNLVEGKSVTLEFDVQKKDKYNRLLAYVYVGEKMVNLEMVKQGYAMIYTYPPNVKYAEDFLAAQMDARKNKRGLWLEADKEIISSSEARDYIGEVKVVETEVLDTYISEKVLILNCRNNFKVVVFRNNFQYFPKEMIRSPDTHFKHKTIRAYGMLKEYKGSSEIIANHPSQIQITLK